MATLRHYKFMTSSMHTFYVPVVSSRAFDDSTSVTAQLFRYFKVNGYDPHDLIILETSMQKVKQNFMSWFMSKEYDNQVRNLS